MEDLQWPPRREDLLQLYCEQKLSAAKIAGAYGLNYPNPKSGETLVLYHLKKFGIPRRDRTEHVRKVTERMVDEWVRRYQEGESLSKIAGGKIGTVTVWKHLTKRGVKLRDKVDAQVAAVSKYERRPFSGDKLEKAYLIGLRYGDLNVVRHGRAIRARVSTTHPAMAELFESLLSPYGHIQKYPRLAKLTGYEWTLECDLDASFEFLLIRQGLAELEAFPRDEWLAFVGGLFDAEGTIYFHKKGRGGDFELFLTNKDNSLLGSVQRSLEVLGVFSKLEERMQNPRRLADGKSEKISRLVVWRSEDVRELLGLLDLKHDEKARKKELVTRMMLDSASGHDAGLHREWEGLLNSIKSERDTFVKLASEAIQVESA